MRLTWKSTMLAVALAAAPAAYAAEPATVAKVDLPRYLGTWYEQARLPMRFQNDCVADVKANYALAKDQTITVTNSCRDKDGKLITAKGQAKVVNDAGSKLQVSFLPKAIRWLPVGKAGYWILRLDDNYQTALVGTPNRKYMWVLSRSPKIDEATLQSYIQTAKQQGYDVSKLIRSGK